MRLKFGAILSQTNKDMTLYPHMYQNVYGNLLQKNVSIKVWPLYKRLYLEKYSECFFVFGVILKATNSSFQKCITFCRSIYVKKAMKLLAFIFEQPSYEYKLSKLSTISCLIGHLFLNNQHLNKKLFLTSNCSLF